MEPSPKRKVYVRPEARKQDPVKADVRTTVVYYTYYYYYVMW